ncbi:hypothetical protein [Pseudoruegeria sp. HB172150]|uniref:hypothetical protein n=1 Tax=Pseudoruegeria sp. HB172150 TaxID=2721164 RepID=UPI0015553ADB|nr:hypothetical protein [Pseudoruegeria sp. HB172150]
MLQWFQQNGQVLNLAVNFAMVGIWIVYLQLFWRSYRRQLSANILISRGAGAGMGARCLISNMSAEYVFIEGVILLLRRGEESWSTVITHSEGLGANGEQGWKRNEGPLAAGDYLDIGRFDDLLQRAFGSVREEDAKGAAPDFDSFEVWVISEYTAERRMVFVRRKFNVEQRGGRWTLHADRIETEQVRGGQKRARIEQILEEHLDDASLTVEQGT